MDKGKFYSGIFIMVGLVVLGLMIPRAVEEYRSYDRTVNVKGLCEKEVKADKVIWPIVYKVLSDDLQPIYAQTDANNDRGGNEECPRQQYTLYKEGARSNFSYILSEELAGPDMCLSQLSCRAQSGHLYIKRKSFRHESSFCINSRLSLRPKAYSPKSMPLSCRSFSMLMSSPLKMVDCAFSCIPLI